MKQDYAGPIKEAGEAFKTSEGKLLAAANQAVISDNYADRLTASNNALYNDIRYDTHGI